MATDHHGTPPDSVEFGDPAGAPSPRPDGPGRPRGRNLLRHGTALLALALTAVALIWSERVAAPTVPTPAPRATPAASFLPLVGLGCIGDAAWSPTGDLIALVGPPNTDCGYGGYSPNMIDIYRAKTDRLVRQLHPDAGVFAALGMPQPAPATPSAGGPAPGPELIYSTLRWSPNGGRLALGYTLLVPGSDPTAPRTTTGLALLGTDGSGERVFVDRGTSAGPAYTIWDTLLGTTVAGLPATVSPDAPSSTLVPAQSYSWGAGGTLVPGAPLTAGAAAPTGSTGLVGDTLGSSIFGPWQPGEAVAFPATANAQTPTGYVYLYGTAFAAWSPDGRYFADGLAVNGLLVAARTPLPPASVLSALQLEHVAALPIRDAALAEAIAHDVPQPIGPAGQFGNANVAPIAWSIAWRPDGKILAELNAHNGYILRGTGTGQVVKSVAAMELPPEALAAPGSAGNWYTPLWSPDGKWLLLPTLALVNTSALGI